MRRKNGANPKKVTFENTIQGLKVGESYVPLFNMKISKEIHI